LDEGFVLKKIDSPYTTTTNNYIMQFQEYLDKEKIYLNSLDPMILIQNDNISEFQKKEKKKKPPIDSKTEINVILKLWEKICQKNELGLNNDIREVTEKIIRTIGIKFGIQYRAIIAMALYQASIIKNQNLTLQKICQIIQCPRTTALDYNERFLEF